MTCEKVMFVIAGIGRGGKSVYYSPMYGWQKDITPDTKLFETLEEAKNSPHWLVVMSMSKPRKGVKPDDIYIGIVGLTYGERAEPV